MISNLQRLTLVLAIGFSQPLAVLHAQETTARSLFDQWDKNSDSKLARDELPEDLRRNFDRVDRNGDGHISREEDAAARGSAPGRKTNRKPRREELPEGIEKLADLDYAGTDNPRQKLDLYLPKGRAKTSGLLPLLVFIHGGGWRTGDKAGGINRLKPFLEGGGFAGASVGYRLSEEAQWPSQIHDCKAAIRFLKANAMKYGIDPQRIAVFGTSAGGHLVAMLGVTGDVPELEGEVGPHLDGADSKVACVVDFFGPSDLLSMNGEGCLMDHEAPGSPESLLVGGPILERKDIARQASPITHVSEADAPMLIVHGDEDPMVIFSQSVKFEKALEGKGVPTTLITVAGGRHGKGFGPKVNELVELFLLRQLMGSEAELADQVIKAGE